jgi:hypothetical protein
MTELIIFTVTFTLLLLALALPFLFRVEGIDFKFILYCTMIVVFAFLSNNFAKVMAERIDVDEVCVKIEESQI